MENTGILLLSERKNCKGISEFLRPVKPTTSDSTVVTVSGIKKKPSTLNVIGPQVRKLRMEKGWSQEYLAVKLQLAGWDMSRNAVTTLENQQRRAPDLELLVIAKVLGVKTDDLFPRDLRGKRLRELWPHYRAKLSRGQVPPPI